MRNKFYFRFTSGGKEKNWSKKPNAVKMNPVVTKDGCSTMTIATGFALDHVGQGPPIVNMPPCMIIVES